LRIIIQNKANVPAVLCHATSSLAEVSRFIFSKVTTVLKVFLLTFKEYEFL
jgi:hypothetical protein